MTIDGRLTVTISAPKEHNLSEPQREFLRALEKRVQRIWESDQ